MSQNLFVNAADIFAILISLSHAGTGFGHGAAAAVPLKPVPARLWRIKIAEEISAETVSYEVARMVLKNKMLVLHLCLFFSMFFSINRKICLLVTKPMSSDAAVSEST